MDNLTQHRRLQHIVDSYSLAGDADAFDTFSTELDLLRKDYPWFLVELAVVEVLVENWLRYPMPRGLYFLKQVQERLQEWRETSIISSFLNPDQFEQITGLPPWGFDMLQVFSIQFSESGPFAVKRSPSDRRYTAN